MIAKNNNNNLLVALDFSVMERSAEQKNG